jgi:hypothetical protein
LIRLEVPEEFIDMLDQANPLAAHIIDCLDWATKNQGEALRVVEEWKKLGWDGKKVFAKRISAYDPLRSIEDAKEHEREFRAKIKSVQRMVSSIKRRGEYRLVAENEVECVVRPVDEYRRRMYSFDVGVQGDHMTLVYEKDGIAEVLRKMESGKPSIIHLRHVIYQGRQYVGNLGIFIEAIRRNISPRVLMAVDPPKDLPF